MPEEFRYCACLEDGSERKDFDTKAEMLSYAQTLKGKVYGWEFVPPDGVWAKLILEVIYA